MATIETRVRWADNTKELAANLKSGLDQIEAMKSSAERLTKTLGGDGLFRAANNLTAAIGQLGGATKLTDSEQQRALTTLDRAIEKYKSMGMTAPTAMRQLADSMRPIPEQATLADKALGFLKGTVAGMAAAFTLAGLIERATGALVGWTREVIDGAGKLVDLSAKTGVSIEQLQRFAFVGKQAGVTVDDFSTASFKLGVNLSGGSRSVVSALKELNLSYEDIRRQAPDQQFNAIVKSLESMTDPQDRNRIGVELFGKSFATIAPAISAGYTDMAAKARVSSDAQIKALDDASDAWDRFVSNQKSKLTSWLGDAVLAREQISKLTGEQMAQYQALLKGGGDAQGFLLELNRKQAAQHDIVLPKQQATTAATIAYTAELAKAKDQLAELSDTEVNEIIAAGKLGKSQQEITDRYGVSEAVIRLLNQRTSEYEQTQKKAASESVQTAKKIAEANQKFRDSVTVLTSSAIGATKGFGAYGALMPDLSNRTEAFRERLEELSSTTNEFHNGISVAGEEVRTVTIPAFSQLPNVVSKAASAIKQVREEAEKSTGPLGAIGDKVSSLWKGLSGGKGLSGVFENIGSGAIDQVGRLITGGIGSLVNLGLKGIGSLFGKLFGNPEKEINPVRQAYVDAAGGLAELNDKAFKATGSLQLVQNLLNARNAEQYTAAINALNQALGDQDSALATVKETADKYGLTLAEMGPQFRQGQLNEQLLNLYRDQQILTAAGADFDVVIQKQASSFQDLITTALQTGATIPEQLRPAVQKLIDMGLVTDLAGDKLEDIGELTFAETLDSKFTTLIDTIQKLADTIARSLGGAIASIPRTVTIDVGYNVGDGPSFGDGRQTFANGGFVKNLPHFAAGGVTPDTQLGWFAPGELVLNQAQQGNVADGLMAGARSNVVSFAQFRSMQTELVGLRESHDRFARYMQLDQPRAIAQAVREATQDGRRRG